MNETKDHIESFTRREERLMDRIGERYGYPLPERLLNWRTWIQDSAIYLNELSDYADRLQQ